MKIFSVISSATLFCFFVVGCDSITMPNNKSNEQMEVNVYSGTATRIDLPTETRSLLQGDDYKECYRCSSDASNVMADVVITNDKKFSAIMVDFTGQPNYVINFDVIEIDNDGSAIFLTKNEFGDNLFKGKYNKSKAIFEVLEIYNTDVVTRAVSQSWGCSMSLGLAGGIWSFVLGGVPGFVVGLAYTAIAAYVCDENNGII